MARVSLLMDLPKDSGAGRYAVELQKRINEPFAIDYLYFDYDQRSLVLERENERRILFRTYRFPALDNKIWFWRRLKKHIPKYDLYHFITPNLSFLVLKGKKSLVTCHDIAPLFIPTNFREKLWRRYLYSGLSRADALIADSESTRNDVCKVYPVTKSKVTVIPLGVDRERFRPLSKKQCRRELEIPLERKVILNVALEHWRKNIPGLLKILALVKEHYPDILLLRVGAPREETVRLIQNLGLTDNVRYLPIRDEEELVRAYNAADVFAFPSYYEGFGLPVLEAMACGTPVVASKRTSIPEIVGGSSVLVDPDDTATFAREVERVLKEKEFAQSLADRGLERATKFSWEKTTRETEVVYDYLLRGC